MIGTIYVIRADGTDLVKIGFTHDLEKRLHHLSRSGPYRLSVVRTIDGSRQTERWFHQRFSGKRLNGEWFSHDPAMLSVFPPDEKLPTRGEGKAASDIAVRFLDALRSRYGHLPDGAERLAADAGGATPRAAKNWLAGRCLPHATALIQIMQADLTIRAAILAMVEEAKCQRSE